MSEPDPQAIARALICQFESCALAPYRDPAGYPTIGWGFRFLADGSPVTMVTPSLTQAQADAQRDEKIGQLAAHVDPLLPANATPWQKGALYSFAWNEGIGALKESTLLRRYRDGDILAAVLEFRQWVYAGGRVLPGLVARRNAESRVFAGVGYAPPSSPPPAPAPDADDLNAQELDKLQEQS